MSAWKGFIALIEQIVRFRILALPAEMFDWEEGQQYICCLRCVMLVLRKRSEVM